MKKYLLLLPAFFAPSVVSAHCPLCTAGAGVLAVLAASLGVSSIIVGILIGAFALALGLWIAPLVRRQYIPFQKYVLTLLIFLGTVVPIAPLIVHYSALYVALMGEYGSLLHNTYMVNLFGFGSVLGALVVMLAPYISRLITRIRGRQIPYQGLSITIGLLVVMSVIVQVLS